MWSRQGEANEESEEMSLEAFGRGLEYVIIGGLFILIGLIIRDEVLGRNNL